LTTETSGQANAPRPRENNELSYEVLKSLLGTPGAEHLVNEIDRLVIQPKLRLHRLYCITACFIATVITAGAVTAAVLIHRTSVSVVPAGVRISAGWLIPGGTVVTLISTLAFRIMRRRRRASDVLVSARRQRQPSGLPAPPQRSPTTAATNGARGTTSKRAARRHVGTTSKTKRSAAKRNKR